MKVGVLALQGDVREHLQALREAGAQSVPVKFPYELAALDGLIIPGGESTTIGKLMQESGLDTEICKLSREGLPLYGTCAGAIMLARGTLDGSQDQPLLGLMEIQVKRNAYGRQNESFETDVEIPSLKIDKFRGVFIRAPWIEKAEKGVEVLASLQGKGIMARQGNLLATTFHPELSGDRRIHEYFLRLIEGRT